MKYNPDIHHRRSIRLKHYDYSQPGAYFVTICTHDRECLFGEIVNNEMILNEYGKIVYEEWFLSTKIRNEIELYENEFVVMPNHIHGIVWVNTNVMDVTHNVGATGRSPLQKHNRSNIQNGHLANYDNPHGPKNKSLSSFIAGYKSSVTKRINQIRQTQGIPVWQRNYYEHIIRNEIELNKIREYILKNPLNWETDENYKI
jgi:putative transposase